MKKKPMPMKGGKVKMAAARGGMAPPKKGAGGKVRGGRSSEDYPGDR